MSTSKGELQTLAACSFNRYLQDCPSSAELQSITSENFIFFSYIIILSYLIITSLASPMELWMRHTWCDHDAPSSSFSGSGFVRVLKLVYFFKIK